MSNKKIERLALAAMFLALGLVLPFFTGQIPQIGSMLLPMHIPVFLCGLVCGWQYGLGVGFLTPLLRSAVFGMPVMYPTALAMAFELAVYGGVIGVLYQSFRKKNTVSVYVSLLIAMVCGRVVWGVVQTILLGVNAQVFTLQAFLAAAFFKAIPGIVLQLILIPTIMLILRRRQMIDREKI